MSIFSDLSGVLINLAHTIYIVCIYICVCVLLVHYLGIH